MHKLGVLTPIFLFGFCCATFCTLSAQAQVQPRPNSPAPQPSTGMRAAEEAQQKCTDSYQGLPVDLRLDSTRVSGTDEQARLQRAVWNFLCTRRHLEEQHWGEVFTSAGLAKDSPRNLSGNFVKALVASTVFDVPGYSEIAIDGATIEGDLDLTHEVLRSGLSIRNSTFRGRVSLNFLRAGYDVDFTSSSFCGAFEAQSMRVDGSLYFGRSGSLDKKSTSSCSPLNENRHAFIQSINLTKSNITGELSIYDTYVADAAIFHSAIVGRVLLIGNSSLNALDLSNAEVGQLELVGSEFRSTDALWADGISVAHAVFLNRSHFRGKVGMSAARIKSDLSIRGATFDSGLDLSLSKIDGDFLLGSGGRTGFTSWNSSTDLSLEHAEVGFIRAPLNAWPANFKANGFRFAGFGQPDINSGDGTQDYLCEQSLDAFPAGSWSSSLAALVGGNAKPKACYIADWITKIDYSPSVIDWLRQKQKGAGNEPLANKIGILSKNHERNSAWAEGRYLDWLALALSGLFIGYGYNPWLSGLWACVFLVVGALVFRTSSAARQRTNDPPHKPYNPVLYSFDLLLPFVELRKGHYDLYIQENPQRWYFYFHRIMGYVLGLFLIGALSGLTK